MALALEMLLILVKGHLDYRLTAQRVFVDAAGVPVMAQMQVLTACGAYLIPLIPPRKILTGQVCSHLP